MKLKALVLATSLLSACETALREHSDSSNPPSDTPNPTPPEANGVQGTFRSIALDLKSAIIYPGDMVGSGKAYFLTLSDQPDICGLMKDNVAARNATALYLVLAATDSAGKYTNDPPTAPGAYTAQNIFMPPPSSQVGGGWISKYDDNCTDIVADTMGYSNYASMDTSVTVIDEIVAGVGAKGSFVLHFPSGDQLTGKFEATACDTTYSPTASPTCR